MRVLVIYQLHSANDRNTISEHLSSFKRYSDHDFHYFNVSKKLPKYLFNQEYDVIIFHYTYLAGERFLEEEHKWRRKTSGAENLRGYKIAAPQDEYDQANRLCEFFDRAKIQTVYTCFTREEDIHNAYRKHLKSEIIFEETWTGFVDSETDEEINSKVTPIRERKIDIGYRARKLPAYFGRHGQLKYELVNVFTEYLRKTDLVFDINNTNNHFNDEDKAQVKMGDSWLDFLLSCKAFIGCEGGSSLLDFNGEIKNRVLEYGLLHPNASFDEIEMNCFSGLDYNIGCFALSPRHFECATTKTLQILVEGAYGGVFKPDLHYIELKRDFSNLSEVVEKLEDLDYCQQIVDRAYQDIVKSGKYTYKSFVDNFFRPFSSIESVNIDFRFKITRELLNARNWFIMNRNAIFLPFLVFKNFVYRKVIIPNPALHRFLKLVKYSLKGGEKV